MPDADAPDAPSILGAPEGASAPTSAIQGAHRGAADDLASRVSRLPLWQRRIIAMLQSGISLHDARERVNVSQWTLERATADSRVFADALAVVDAGIVLVGTDDARAIAVAHAGGIIEDSVAASRATPYERDRVANRRLVLEAAQAIGVGARGAQASGAAISVAQAVILVGRQERDALAKGDAAPSTPPPTPSP